MKNRSTLLRLALPALAVSFAAAAHAAPTPSPKEAWARELADYERESPTSYLNLNDMAYLEPKGKVGLDPKAPHAAARWIKDPAPGKGLLTVRRDGTTVRVQDGTGRNLAGLGDGGHWTSPNGLLLSVGAGRFNVRVGLHDPRSPSQKAFRGLSYFPYAPDLVVRADFQRNAKPEPVRFETSRKLFKDGFKVGVLRFVRDGTPCALEAFALGPLNGPHAELYVPFRDATTGRESYGGGRNVDIPLPGGVRSGPVTVDFNRAYNPLCARSPFFNCILYPGNKLPIAIRAGEKAPPPH